MVNRVLLLRSSQGIQLDVALGGMDFEERVIERSVLKQFGEGTNLRVASAEDLIVQKSFASRPKDWGDVEQIVRRQGEKLRLDQIKRELENLCLLSEDTSPIHLLQAVLKRHGLQL